MWAEFFVGLVYIGLICAGVCWFYLRHPSAEPDVAEPDVVRIPVLPTLQKEATVVRTAREVLTDVVEAGGQGVNEARLAAVAANMPFIAGILRGAEEAIKVAYDMLSTPETPDSEL